MIKYSFVLPAYKACYFKEALDSILNQTYSDFELIIVNDASPEDLDSIVSQYDDPRITYYKNETNIGGKNLVEQWNKSLAYANGNILHIDGYISEYLSKIEYLYFWTSRLVGSGIPFFIFKKNALIEIGGFVNYPLAWFSDDATILRLADNGIVTCNKTLFAFRTSNINISTALNNEKSLSAKCEATKLFYEEHNNFLINHVPENEEEAFLMPSVCTCFKLLIKDKVKSQLRRSTLKAIRHTKNQWLEIGCIKPSFITRCYKYPILTALKKVF